MKKLFKLLSILIIVLTAYVASLNASQSVNFHIWNNISHEINLVYVIFGALVAGVTVGYAWMFTHYLTSQEKFKEYKKKLEHTTVTAESGSSKVNVLEAKIEVLEKALKSALEKGND
jgi:uncharacterized integral membrane protein